MDIFLSLGNVFDDIAIMYSNCADFYQFLVADTQLYKRLCPSVGPSVGPSVRPLVRNAFVKIDEKWSFMDSK